MTHATPPGWYPDVNMPGTERWWDGTAWTGYTRSAAATQPVAPPSAARTARSGHRHPGRGGDRGGPARRRRRHRLPGAGRGRRRYATGLARPAPARGPPPRTARPARRPPRRPEDDPTVLVDQLDAVTLPGPRRAGRSRSTPSTTPPRCVRPGPTTCPGDSGSFCYHGTVTVRTAGGTDLHGHRRRWRRPDIGTAADRAYGKNTVGGLIHGGIRSHKDLASKPVTVAGRTGYLVRRQVTTGKGPGGYVQSLVFPSAVGSETPGRSSGSPSTRARTRCRSP